MEAEKTHCLTYRKTTEGEKGNKLFDELCTPSVGESVYIAVPLGFLVYRAS